MCDLTKLTDAELSAEINRLRTELLAVAEKLIRRDPNASTEMLAGYLSIKTDDQPHKN